MPPRNWRLIWQEKSCIELSRNFCFNSGQRVCLAGGVATGDQIVTVDDYFFTHSADLINYLQKREVGAEVVLEIEREGTKKMVTGKVDLNEVTGRHSSGLQLLDRTKLTSDIPVEIELGAVGGPSAGLMFTLQMYAMASNHDLRNGRDIAEKVYSAANGKAKAFLIPDDEISEEFHHYFPDVQSNYQEALVAVKKLDTERVIVPVKTVQEAIDWLAETGS